MFPPMAIGIRIRDVLIEMEMSYCSTRIGLGLWRYWLFKRIKRKVNFSWALIYFRRFYSENWLKEKERKHQQKLDGRINTKPFFFSHIAKNMCQTDNTNTSWWMKTAMTYNECFRIRTAPVASRICRKWKKNTLTKHSKQQSEPRNMSLCACDFFLFSSSFLCLYGSAVSRSPIHIRMLRSMAYTWHHLVLL